MTASIDVVPIPNLAYYLVVNVRECICRLGQIGQGFAQQGWQESNPRPPGWDRLSVPLDYRLSRFQWGVSDRSFGGLMGLGHVTPPAWSSTRSL